MNVLSYVIPAIREIRAPLVGGYLWLFAAWLAWGQEVPRAGDIDPTSPWADVHRLADAVGPAGVAVAISLLAYLVGALVGELIQVCFRAFGVDQDRLADLGDTMAEVKIYVESTQRTLAEAELRFHILLPLCFVGLVLDDAVWVQAMVAAGIVAMMVHGALLLTRTRIRAIRASEVASKVRESLTVRERQARSAQIDVKVWRDEGGRSGRDFIRFSNSGNDVARNVNIESTDDNELDFLMSGSLPIEEIRPRDEIDVPIALSMGSPQTVSVRVSWIDPTGERSYERSLRLY